MYVYERTIRLGDTDASGLIYFAALLRIAHEAFEDFLESQGHHVGELIGQTDFLLPIVHAEADYKGGIFAGDQLSIELSCEKIGTTSIVNGYRVLKKDGTVAATAKTVHVAIDQRTRQKTPLSDEFRELISKL